MSLTIDSRPFGRIEISEKQILSFSEGLFGFEEFTTYALIEEDSDSVFKWLQCLQDPELAFIVVHPNYFLSHYDPLLTEMELQDIGLESIEDSLILLIVTIPDDNPAHMTANTQGPVVINPKNKRGKQYISNDDNHIVRKRIFEANEDSEEE